MSATILVGYDGSVGADHAVELAGSLARGSDTVVRLVTAVRQGGAFTAQRPPLIVSLPVFLRPGGTCIRCRLTATWIATAVDSGPTGCSPWTGCARGVDTVRPQTIL
jgi:nucleotide-binding universal stress UspA family protein